MTWEAFNFPRRFGSYVLVFPLGVGGMGNVFLAVGGQGGRERPCVLKRLIPESAQDADRIARIRREAEVASRLVHPAIVRTHGIEEIDGEPVIVQEFLQGRTLTQALSATRSATQTMSVELAVHIVHEIASALAYAHSPSAGGIIHRDVSPENVMVTFDGGVRLIDFGIARAANDPKLTQAGVVVGKENYIAPEVFHGSPADARSDVYSLGVVLWELLTDSPLLPSDRAEGVAPSARARGSIPAELDTVVLKALAPALTRFQSADELGQALSRFLPRGFKGSAAVARFLGRCYDIEAETRRLEESVTEAKALLEPAQTAVPTKKRGRAGRLLAPLAGTAALAVTLVGGVLWIRSGSSAQTPLIAAKAPPQAPAVLPAAGSIARPDAAHAAPLLVNEVPVPQPLPTTPISKRASTTAARTRTPSRGLAATAVPPASESLEEAKVSLQAGEPGAAETQARRSLGVGSPTQQAQAHVIIGKTYILRQRLRDAEKEFEIAVRLDPRSRAAAKELAQLRAQMGLGETQ